MKHGAKYFDFFYDANGTAAGFAYRQVASSAPTYYYYGVNTRGDVEVIYNSSGLVLAKYKYDAYGKLLNVTNSADVTLYDPDSIAHLNPLRYRSYVYDTESGLYYLQARYYDPTTCRFINADPAYISTGQGINGNNMFAYCNNNPVMYSDPTGTKIFECCPYGDCWRCKIENNVGCAVEYEELYDIYDQNCYTYALQVDCVLNPGYYSGIDNIDISNVNDVWNAVVSDAYELGYTIRQISGPNSKVNSNEYKVALRVGTKPYSSGYVSPPPPQIGPSQYVMLFDYHFMIQTKSGRWAEKHGAYGASDLHDFGETPNNIPWILGNAPYYDSDIIYFAIGK